ncbi:carboxyl-terminal-processing peptidase 2, chloroplastic isoform X5 [Ziziphus jujuba]|uniref:Carboxyl-terminal-processing peptidase 2, chloroplastic isoform X5 n=1 Tax=Ziziphus jujuba TaxID=326968 RepID=A0A6P6GBG1_ZIZJJ|nr:carboxyl-terminal-processing peptidase 2, chloroplastic isoform X5 [Ziziphus jujuba]
MEFLAISTTASSSSSSFPHFPISSFFKNPNSNLISTTSSVLQWKYLPVKVLRNKFHGPLMCMRIDTSNGPRNGRDSDGGYAWNFLLQHKRRLCKRFTSQYGLFSESYKCIPKFWKYAGSLCKLMNRSEIRQKVSVHFGRLVVGVMLVMSLSVAVSKTPSDMAIKKMLATLDDPFTRFLEPEKFKSLQSGTQGALTGVGLSIGYPTKFDGSPAGLVVISAAPGGPANKAGVLSGDIILAIDDTSTETMGIYDAADRLQGPEGSSVKLTIQSGPEIKHLDLVREKVQLNPVKSRLCKVPDAGDNSPRIGYIKLTSFNQNASGLAFYLGAVKEAVDALRSNNVNAFVLDLRDNSGGLFPEGIEIAKIWLDKGVIVYICDSRGVRDIYDTDGSSAMAASEPLAVLVNKGTASASEILAGALKDNKRAVVFGEPTFGKGKIQSVFKLSDGSGLAVTVARYETPAHADIDKVGVIPDHPLPTLFPKDEDSFCSCIQDPASGCYVNRGQLFSR